MNRTLFLVALVSLPSLAHAAERHVGVGQAYATVQAAVDAAQNGDTVVVHAGRYVEQVVIDAADVTTLEIEGYGTDVVTIAAPDTVVNAIIANTVNLTLRNLTVEAPYRLTPAPRAISFISDTGSLAETFTLGLCDVTLQGDGITGSAGAACGAGLNDTLRVRGDQIGFPGLPTKVTTSCSRDSDWDLDDEFCSGQ